jgi:hypothetical protein
LRKIVPKMMVPQVRVRSVDANLGTATVERRD